MESELTRTLGAVLDTRDDVDEIRADAEPDGELADQLLAELAVACRRVELARRFHNDVVRSCPQLRRKRVVRRFRLAAPDCGRSPGSRPRCPHPALPCPRLGLRRLDQAA